MTSKTTVLAVVIFLGLVALVVTVGGVILANNDKPIPGELIALGSGALGALAGILSSSRSTLGKNDIEPTATPGMVPVRPAAAPLAVNVVNTEAEPVPTTDADPTVAGRMNG